MINSKKVFTCLAVVLCFSFCIGTVSHAKTMISYKETVFDGMGEIGLINDFVSCKINSSGKLELNIYDYEISSKLSKAERKKLNKAEGKEMQGKSFKRYAKVTFDSKGKKKVVSRAAVNYKKYLHYIHDDRSYIVKYEPYAKKGKNERKLIVTSKNEKIIKKINLNISNYIKNKKDCLYLRLVEVKGRKKVRLSYCIEHTDNRTDSYGGIIEVNTITGKIKKIVSSNDFIPTEYDGKYVYGKSFEPDSDFSNPEKVTFYMQSLKTGKTTKFTTDAIPYNWKFYVALDPVYSFYKGKIMGIEPDGKVFYGTFSNKKFEQIGDISGCKYFKQTDYISLRMKSKNEFYILYNSDDMRRRGDDGNGEDWGVAVVARYKKK